jgi:cell division septation protein DedD
MTEKRKIPFPLYIVFLLVLAAGAIAAAYMLYLYTPDSKNAQRNAAARPVTGSGPAKAGKRIIHAFQPEELIKPASEKTAREEKIETADDAEFEQELSGSTWVLNIISTREPEKAKRIHDILAKSPYRVYTYKVEAQGSSWYRVRVGFFQTYSEAKTACEFIARHFQMPEAWIVTAGPLEMDQYYHDASPDQDGQRTAQ